jgi:hypothetical protein
MYSVYLSQREGQVSEERDFSIYAYCKLVFAFLYFSSHLASPSALFGLSHTPTRSTCASLDSMSAVNRSFEMDALSDHFNSICNQVGDSVSFALSDLSIVYQESSQRVYPTVSTPSFAHESFSLFTREFIQLSPSHSFSRPRSSSTATLEISIATIASEVADTCPHHSTKPNLFAFSKADNRSQELVGRQ